MRTQGTPNLRRRTTSAIVALGLALAATVIVEVGTPVAAHTCQSFLGATPIIGDCGPCTSGNHSHDGLFACQSSEP